MTIKENPGEDRPQIKNDYLSKTGSTYSIDYMIGNPEFLGKGWGAKTLSEFVKFFYNQVDQDADTFFIDPDQNNPRARRVYERAGFVFVGEYIMSGSGFFEGRKTYFLVKRIR